MAKFATRIVTGAALALALPLAGTALAQITTTTISFPKGGTSATVAGTIVGGAIRDYEVRAGEGQTMRVNMSGSSIVYFNVLPPGSDNEAIFTGSTEGNSFSGTLSASGAYKIRVYQMRASARRGEKGAFRLNVSVTGMPNHGMGHGSGHGPGMGHMDGLGGIAGMDSINAIDVMMNRGFTNVDSFDSGNTQYGIFYKRSTGVCAQLTMADGKVVDARDIKTHPKCK
ncbi:MULTISPECIES: hypothetical protein [Novosphingobium]|uniref:Uncharacterized protein n=1 Tax=Novosphingobium mathurense TaxID=428990 RepID=A0A1U6GSA6_9SPHN|nr:MULTISPECIES: hypothetical protein [Novosphingobium]CDO37013.1 exported hypothetical protein [Novosphingobium sp. KN65.2]SLJ86411.1 hypothetical protein SAMN06295987_101236 [Novosphingobium mathurense]